MKQLYDDLWQTQVGNPFAGLNTHAYFLKGKEGNVIFCNTSHEDDIQEIAEPGGIKYQYLSHLDETGASLQSIKKLFGSALCCHIKEEPHIEPSCPVDITFSEQTTHLGGIEVMPTPGDTDGSISFVYRSRHERTYLFTGDTFFQSKGRWSNV
jgi:hydroxyacylglutathione hydrolase